MMISTFLPVGCGEERERCYSHWWQKTTEEEEERRRERNLGRLLALSG